MSKQFVTDLSFICSLIQIDWVENRYNIGRLSLENLITGGKTCFAESSP